MWSSWFLDLFVCRPVPCCCMVHTHLAPVVHVEKNGKKGTHAPKHVELVGWNAETIFAAAQCRSNTFFAFEGGDLRCRAKAAFKAVFEKDIVFEKIQAKSLQKTCSFWEFCFWRWILWNQLLGILPKNCSLKRSMFFEELQPESLWKQCSFSKTTFH